MINLKTKYLGLELKNPIVVGACNLTSSVSEARNMEAAGAAAIVYKSLFEEQIQLERFELDEMLTRYNNIYSEQQNIFPKIEHAGPEEFLLQLKKIKSAVTIPVIGSLNAVYHNTWIDWAVKLANTGIDALELNFYAVPWDFNTNSSNIETKQIAIVKELRKEIKIPIAVKLSPYYTNILNFIKELNKAGANGYVLFNRVFHPEINIDSEEHNSPISFSSPDENRLPLRYAGLLYGDINASIISSTGIYNGADVIKMLLAGADAVQIVSTLYKNGVKHISEMLLDIREWMISKNYRLIDDFKGKLSNKKINDPFIYKRAQYIDILLRSDNVLRSSELV